ncbi:MAG: hypothetical protein F4051_09190 [Boseongicola sp. SB0670_bin_30]|nr:hypothetical protein [Boseongicola sp. SB0670_bin_30]
MTKILAEGIELSFDRRTGLIERFAVTDNRVEVAPLHRAPWVGTGEALTPDTAPHVAALGGDFFCAPFAGREGDSPLHGWPANSAWIIERKEGRALRAALPRQVYGAGLVKDLILRDGHPFVYQSHTFTGGNGHVPVANHANLSLPSGGIIRTSPKAHWETPKDPQESDPARGRSALKYPAKCNSPMAFPGLTGDVDLTMFPWNSRHEDFVIGIEEGGLELGWTAVSRPASGDLFLSLRNPRQLPMTMLWHSNGGRDYPPWNGRHFGCLSVEEGAASHMLGLSDESALCGPGGLSLEADGSVYVRHVIGAIRWPTGEPVADIRLSDASLLIRGEAGARRSLPIDRAFLAP